ncbi:MAG: ribonucleotide-diphosphate reductase subunit alpha, partial [Trichococcus sp.]
MDATKTTFKAGFEKLNKDIERFPHVFPITEDMHVTYEGVSRLVMLDRYSYKDSTKETLSEGDIVILTVKEDPKYPARGTGTVLSVNHKEQTVRIKVSEEYQHNIDDFEVEEGGIVTRRILTLDKPLELFYEQIAMRNAHGLAEVEITPELRHEAFLKFYEEQKALNFIPAGRVLYGAGSGTDVTYFNCYVMPFVPDSRGGISDHRKKVMEIMSRGGGVGSNGSTLRPRHTIVKGVNGRSSGSVSWMDDIAKLTHLVEQGGSRRGAQMIMLADWHPDIFEFIISKMQNPRILRYIIENFEDEQIRMLAKEKLHFTPFSSKDINMYTGIVNYKHIPGHGGFDASVIHEAEKKLRDGGTYTVNNPEFLTGANISVCITDDFMDAVMKGEEYALRFPDVEHYDADAMAHYDAEWTNCGDAREWEATGNAVRTYRTVKARELWRLINVCAT